jgi:hypothetical protein
VHDGWFVPLLLGSGCGDCHLRTKVDYIMPQKEIDRVIQKIMKECGHLTAKQLQVIRLELVNYAFAACIDSAIRREIEFEAEKISVDKFLDIE